MTRGVGHRVWVIPEGYITINVFFEDREPAGPYRLTVPPRRMRHLRFNDLALLSVTPYGTD